MSSEPKVDQAELGKVIRGMQPTARIDPVVNQAELGRSEERRVGKEC